MTTNAGTMDFATAAITQEEAIRLLRTGYSYGDFIRIDGLSEEPSEDVKDKISRGPVMKYLKPGRFETTGSYTNTDTLANKLGFVADDDAQIMDRLQPLLIEKSEEFLTYRLSPEERSYERLVSNVCNAMASSHITDEARQAWLDKVNGLLSEQLEGPLTQENLANSATILATAIRQRFSDLSMRVHKFQDYFRGRNVYNVTTVEGGLTLPQLMSNILGADDLSDLTQEQTYGIDFQDRVTRAIEAKYPDADNKMNAFLEDLGKVLVNNRQVLSMDLTPGDDAEKLNLFLRGTAGKTMDILDANYAILPSPKVVNVDLDLAKIEAIAGTTYQAERDKLAAALQEDTRQFRAVERGAEIPMPADIPLTMIEAHGLSQIGRHAALMQGLDLKGGRNA